MKRDNNKPLPAHLKRFAKRYSHVPSNVLHEDRTGSGLHFGTTKVMGMEYTVAKPSDVEGHAGILGGSGTGKSSCIVLPTLETNDNPFVALDINGEQYERYKNIDKPGKRPVKVLNLSGDEGKEGEFSTYNPLTHIRRGGAKNMVQNCRELVQCIAPLSPDAREPFWTEAAQNLVTGVLLHYIDDGKGFIEIMEIIQSIPLSELIHGIAGSDNENANMFVAQFSGTDDREDNKMILSIAMTITNRIIAFATDPVIKAALTPSENSIEWSDLDTHDIFIRVDQSKLDQWGPVITMILTQLVRTLERRPNKYTPEGQEMKSVLILIDEFPRIGTMNVIFNALATLRIKKVTITLFFQSLSQLDLLYGQNGRRIIMDNCAYLAVLSANDTDTQKYLSDRIGVCEVEKMSHTTTYDAQGKQTGTSRTVTREYEPIVRPEKFGSPKDIMLITPEGFCRVEKAPYYKKKKKKKNIFSPVVEFVKEVVTKVKSFFKQVFWRFRHGY